MMELSYKNHIATVEFQRPEKKNALTLTLWVKLSELVTQASANADCRVLILRSTGEDFCAGADITEFDTVRKDVNSALEYEAANSVAFRTIRECPIPTIAAIKGACFGGGFGIAAACDLRFGEPQSKFCIPPAKLGLAYPVDAMADIVHAIGAQNAKYLAYSAKTIDAQTALEYGFLLEIFQTNELYRKCDELADQISSLAPLTHRATKAGILAVLSDNVQDIDTAVKIGNSTFTSTDYAEGRLAYREKRKPNFQGE